MACIKGLPTYLYLIIQHKATLQLKRQGEDLLLSVTSESNGLILNYNSIWIARTHFVPWFIVTSN